MKCNYMTNTIEMLHAMDDMACLALLGCPQTPGLQIQSYFHLKIFFKCNRKCHMLLFCLPEILCAWKKYQILQANRGAQDKLRAKRIN